MPGIEWLLLAFLSGVIIGLITGVLGAVSSIKKHPERWEEFGATKTL